MSAELIQDPHPLTMTEAEFDRWCWTVDARVEFVDGKVIWMSPVSLVHYEITNFLVALLRGYLEIRPAGRLSGPDFLVQLRAGLKRVPDLMYVLPENVFKIKDTFFEGYPDVAWEIVSKDSVQRDWHNKYLEYQKAGVTEYWIIDPAHQTVALYRLDQGKYAEVKPQDGRYVSAVIRGFWLKDEWLWQLPPPGALDCLREMGVLS